MKTALHLIFACAFLLSLEGSASACTCLPSKGVAQEVELSSAVFSGKVIEIKRHGRAAELFGQVEVVFEVEKSWKGVDKRIVSVFTSSGSASCGYGFTKGRTYLVYTGGSPQGRLSTSICSRTKRLNKAREDLRVLGAGKEVVEAERRAPRLTTHSTGLATSVPFIFDINRPPVNSSVRPPRLRA